MMANPLPVQHARSNVKGLSRAVLHHDVDLVAIKASVRDVFDGLYDDMVFIDAALAVFDLYGVAHGFVL